jgi:hypothetical protein
VAARVRDSRELGKAAFLKARTVSVVLACAARFVAGGVNGGLFGDVRQKAYVARQFQRAGYQAPEVVFFRSFCSA